MFNSRKIQGLSGAIMGHPADLDHRKCTSKQMVGLKCHNFQKFGKISYKLQEVHNSTSPQTAKGGDSWSTHSEAKILQIQRLPQDISILPTTTVI